LRARFFRSGVGSARVELVRSDLCRRVLGELPGYDSTTIGALESVE
jgi:hypothetical protein